MGGPEVPGWLKSLPLAPEYRPTETEFADPIAFISRIEREAAGFGICKVIPPLSKPSKRFVFSNINRSLFRSPDLGPGPRDSCGRAEDGVFTTRHQELGSRRGKGSVHKQVWQSGEVYTLEQFEAKAKAFWKSRLGSGKDVSTLAVESLFWKAVAEKPIYVEYANDVPGSGFSAPEALSQNNSCRRRIKRKFNRGRQDSAAGFLCRSSGRVSESPSIVSNSCNDVEGKAGWKLSNSPWNLQVVARSPGSLTRFMPDEVPGVTSPMIYIGMLFSWFAWHVEDHELHSLNFLHTGSPKTWYAVPGDHAAKLEDVVHIQGYGGDLDRLAAFIMLGEKRTLFSPEILVASGIPCCRLVQNPGEFVVTFPKAYHVGFSHGFNCGEAANFATSKWLNVAKEAAVRRAAMGYLPMLSHQQLLYMLAVSFISRVPRALLPGVRSSRLRDRKKEEREVMVKRAFLDDMITEHNLLLSLVGKESTLYAVYWDPDLLPSICEKGPLQPSTISCDQAELINKCTQEVIQPVNKVDESLNHNVENDFRAVDVGIEKACIDEHQKDERHHNQKECTNLYTNDDDLPCGLDVDAGTLACVACGILGYPFMSVVQPLESLMKKSHGADKRTEPQKLRMTLAPSCREESVSAGDALKVEAHSFQNNNETEKSCITKPSNGSSRDQAECISCSDDVCILNPPSVTSSDDRMKNHQIEAYKTDSIIEHNNHACMKKVPVTVSHGKHYSHMVRELNVSSNDMHDQFEGNSDVKENPTEIREVLGANVVASEANLDRKWNTSDLLMRPRTFCLQHALEVQELLQQSGGCNLLVICHSDYLKIKAQAMSIAEEFGVMFSVTSIPIQNASKSDLDLINMSIDDEECEGNVEDWTSKLGLNLRTCVKDRKETTFRQGRLSLALGRLFSDPIHLSVSSDLRWHSRKSRTHNKGSSLNKGRLLNGAVELEDNKLDKNQSGISEKVQMNGANENPHLCMAKVNECCSRPREVLFANQMDDIDKEICSSGCLILSNEADELCSALTPRNSETCKEIHEASVCAGSILPSHFPMAIKLHVENKVAGTNSDTVDVSDSAKDFSSYTMEHPAILEDALCTNAWQNDGEVGSLVETQVQQHMPPDVTKAEEILENESMDFARVISNSEIPGESKTVAKNEDNSHPDNMDLDVANSGMRQESSGAMNFIVKPAECDTPVSAQENAMALLQQRKHFEESNTNAIAGGDQGTAGTSIKCYVRRKKTAKNVNLISTIFDTVKSSPCSASPVTQDFETHKSVPTVEEKTQVQGGISSPMKGDGDSDVSDIKQSEKCRKKRKREIDPLESDQFDFSGFVRSPCERLRARSGRNTDKMHDRKVGTVDTRNVLKRSTALVAPSKKTKGHGEHQCDLEGCHMKFKTKEELVVHKRNRCTYEGCEKRFSKHRYVMRHQRVHADERPLKCSWKGCTMSFKWAWARTEHLRVHTGERPYKCEVAGCGLTFRFVSDFSRHRRKTGHHVDTQPA